MPMLLAASGAATLGAFAFLHRRRNEQEGPTAIA